MNHRYTLDGVPVAVVLASNGQHTYDRVDLYDGVWVKQCGTETCPQCAFVYSSALRNCPHCLAHNECYESPNPNGIVTAGVCMALVSLGVLAWVFVN